VTRGFSVHCSTSWAIQPSFHSSVAY